MGGAFGGLVLCPPVCSGNWGESEMWNHLPDTARGWGLLMFSSMDRSADV